MEKHFCLDDSPMFRMIELDEVDSTNNFLRHLDTPGDNRMTLVTAEFQTAGRGADQNHWESAKGENLLLSLRVMPSNLPARRMFAISEVAALAVKNAFDAFLPNVLPFGQTQAEQCSIFNVQCSMFKVKWPNDIYYGDSKVAGILIENDLQGALVLRSTIGIGININQRHFLSDAPNPRSLADIVGHDVERRFVLEQFMECFTHYFEQIENGSPDALDALHEQYKGHLYRRDEEHTYIDKNGTFRATLIEVESTGHLILQDTKGNQRRYEFKEVKFGLNEE
jgi:BirA family biotin operon repressor/biotin-[acetyl-CoA-carboxylase] ligase